MHNDVPRSKRLAGANKNPRSAMLAGAKNQFFQAYDVEDNRA